MKKILLTMLLIFASLQNVCMARIDFTKIYLGGLNIHSTIHDVLKIYGQPNRTEENNSVRFHETLDHYWGDGSFMVRQIKTKDILSEIRVSANNGIKTSEGIRVGMDEEVLVEIYGRPDDIYRHNGKKVYCYYPLLGTGSQTIPLIFEVKNGKIFSISIRSEA